MFKKLWLLVSLILATSMSTGLAFGHWSSVANVNAQITSGDLCFNIVGNPTQLDHGDDWTLVNQSAPLDIANNPLAITDCNIGSTTVTVQHGCLHIVMNNVYPTYANEFSFDLHNCGTVPLVLTNVTFIPENNTQGWHAVTAVTSSSSQYFTLDLNGDGQPDLEVFWAGFIGYTFCPGVTLENSFYIHFLEPVPQHVTLVLDIQINCENCEPTSVT